MTEKARTQNQKPENVKFDCAAFERKNGGRKKKLSREGEKKEDHMAHTSRNVFPKKMGDGKKKVVERERKNEDHMAHKSRKTKDLKTNPQRVNLFDSFLSFEKARTNCERALKKCNAKGKAWAIAKLSEHCFINDISGKHRHGHRPGAKSLVPSEDWIGHREPDGSRVDRSCCTEKGVCYKLAMLEKRAILFWVSKPPCHDCRKWFSSRGYKVEIEKDVERDCWRVRGTAS